MESCWLFSCRQHWQQRNLSCQRFNRMLQSSFSMFLLFYVPVWGLEHPVKTLIGKIKFLCYQVVYKRACSQQLSMTAGATENSSGGSLQTTWLGINDSYILSMFKQLNTVNPPPPSSFMFCYINTIIHQGGYEGSAKPHNSSPEPASAWNWGKQIGIETTVDFCGVSCIPINSREQEIMCIHYACCRE